MFTKFKNEDLSVDFCPHFFFKVNLRVVKPNSNKKSSQKANKELIKKTVFKPPEAFKLC